MSSLLMLSTGYLEAKELVNESLNTTKKNELGVCRHSENLNGGVHFTLFFSA